MFLTKVSKVLTVRIVNNEDGQNRRGIAFIDVESQEQAENALELNNYLLEGQQLRVYISKPPEKQEEALLRTVFVSNLP